MIDQLQKKPDHFFEIANDKQAKTLLVELELMALFVETSGLQTQIIASAKHPTHFIVALFFSGKKKKGGNGYLVFCLPRKRFPPESAAQFLEQIALNQDTACSIKFLPATRI